MSGFDPGSFSQSSFDSESFDFPSDPPVSRLDCVVSSAAADNIPPSAPVITSVTPVGDNRLDITWTASTDNVRVAGYRVFASSNNLNYSIIQTLSAASLTYSHVGVPLGAVRWYMIEAFDDAGNLALSAVASGSTIEPDTTPPTAPTISAVATSDDTVWVVLVTPSTDNVGVEYYSLEYKRAVDSTWTLDSDTIEEELFDFDISGLAADTQYNFRSRAKDFAGNWSAYSSTVSATTEAASGQLNLSIDGYAMPDLDDEIAYYDSLNWSYTQSQLPNFGSDPNYAISFSGHIHDTVEGDGVWDNLMMYVRTADEFYYDRALAWADYYKSAIYFELGGLSEALTTTPKAGSNSYGDPGVESQLWNDVRQFSGDHSTGWGLIALYVLGGRSDQTLLDRAEQFGEVLTDYVCASPMR